MMPGGAGSGGGHVAVIGVVFALLVLPLSVGAGSDFHPGQPARPDHDPIHIRGDSDLVLPDSVSGNGIRRGIGTEDRPYLIENWTIRYESEGRAAIRIESTTLHLVIQRIDFEWPQALPRIEIVDAENVTVRNLRLDGPDNGSRPSQMIVGQDLHSVRLDGVLVNGSGGLEFDRSTNLLLEDVRMEGWDAHIDVSGGGYRIRNITVHASPRIGTSRSNGNIKLAATHGPMPACHLQAKNIVVSNALGSALEVLGEGCHAEFHDVYASSSDVGIEVDAKASARIVDSTFRLGPRDPRLRDPPAPGLDHRRSTFYIHDGASLEVRGTESEGYYHGMTIRGGAADIRRTHFRNHTIGFYIDNPCTPCHVHNSSLLSTGEMLVVNEGASTLDARWNWWGSPDGPDPARIEGDVRYEPWRTEGPAPPAGEEALPSPGTWAVVATVVGAAVGMAWRRS